MIPHELLLKLTHSHKPVIFFGNYQERLLNWHHLRSVLDQLENPLDVLLELFKHCPRSSTDTDAYKPHTWLTGWQLIERNQYNLFDICLLLYYSLALTDTFKNANITIHSVGRKNHDTNNYKFSLIFELNSQYIDIHSMEKISNIEFDKNYIINYTHNISNKINIE